MHSQPQQQPPKSPSQKFYSKREHLLYNDPINNVVYPIFRCVRMLETEVLGRIPKARDKMEVGVRRDGMEFGRGERVFGRMVPGQFMVKFSRIIKYLDRQYKIAQRKGQKNYYRIFKNWLIKLIKTPDKPQHFSKSSPKFQQKLYTTILQASKNRPEPYQPGQQGVKDWFMRFLRENQLADQLPPTFYESQQRMADFYGGIQEGQERQIKEEEEQEFYQENQQYQAQVRARIPQFPRMDKLISKKAQQLVRAELPNLSSDKRKPQPQPQQQQKVLRLQKPKCPTKSCKKSLQVRKCVQDNHSILICDKCSWTQHECHSQLERQSQQPVQYYQYFTIIAKGQRIRHFDLPRLQPTPTPNNIIPTILSLQYEYTSTPVILPQTPRSFICHYPILPDSACQQIVQNRQEEQLLPLEIRESSVEGAGLGVYVTNEIVGPGVLVCSYLGEIGLGSHVPVTRQYGDQVRDNDSVYTLGWLDKQDVLITAPSLYTNIGRFINYNIPSKCNIKPSICLIQPNKGQFEIVVFFVTLRRIEGGEELFYNYGPEYGEGRQEDQ